MRRLLTALLVTIVYSVFAGNETELKTYETKAIKNLSYLTEPTDDEYRQKMSQLNLYLPEGAKNFPTLVYFHGGGLTGGSRGGPTNLVKHGVAVAAVEYRLYPKCKHPEYIEDCALATAWVFKNISKYGGDPGKIFIGGYSAGSYLAGMLAMDKKYLAANEVDADKLAGVLLQSGHTITHFTVRKQFGYKVQQGICDENSPMYHIRKTPFPILLQCGDNDYPSRQEENRLFESMMIRYAKQPRDHIEYREYAGTHGTLGSNPDFKQDTEAFVRKHSGLPYKEASSQQKAKQAYSRSCFGKSFVDASEFQNDAAETTVLLDGKSTPLPESGGIGPVTTVPAEIAVVKNYKGKVKKIPAVKEYQLKNGQENALNCPGGVRFWAEKGKLFVELKKDTGKPKAPQKGKYYSGDGIEIFVDRTPLRKFAKDSNQAFPKVLGLKQYLFAATPDTDGKSFAVKDMARGFADITEESGATLTSQPKADGYTMLIAIPLAEISALNDQNVIGLNIQVNNFASGKNKPVNLSGTSQPSYAKRLHYPLFKLAASTQ